VPFTRGRLHPPEAAPAVGEDTHRLAALGDVVVDQILSGRLETPVHYQQDEDEWVIVLQGQARLDVDGHSLVLSPGDWVSIPARTPHRLVETEPGTSWLTVTSSPSSASVGV
jgi:cupin 2 domain-containing protein